MNEEEKEKEFMRAVVVIAAVSGLVAVVMGAAAAHSLASALAPEALDWIETGARYGGWHATVLLAVAALMAVRPARALTLAAAAFAAGIFLFSGSLFALALTGLRGLAALTPIGGGLLIAGWGLLVVYGLKLKGR